MDGQRFDQLTRLIATGTSRRRMVSLLGGGLGGLILGRTTGRAQCANPETCLNDGECCTGFVCDLQSSACVEAVPCVPDGDACADSSRCCTGDCYEGTCLQCRGHGQACESMFDCCTADCYLGVCVPCRELGAPCSFEWHCCAGKCLDDTVCVACGGNGSVCSDPAKCCSGDCSN